MNQLGCETITFFLLSTLTLGIAPVCGAFDKNNKQTYFPIFYVSNESGDKNHPEICVTC